MIVGGRVSDATSAQIIKTTDSVLLKANGFVGAVQMTLTHSDDFSIELTNNAMVADYNTVGNSTTLFIVLPNSEELFTFDGLYEVSDLIIANSNSIIDASIVTPDTFNLSSAYPNPFNPLYIICIKFSS